MLGLILAGAQLALGIGSAIANHKAQNQAAAEAERANAEQRRQVTDAANKSAAAQNHQLDFSLDEQQLSLDQTIGAIAARRGEERTAARQSILATDRSARMADATGRLSAGAAGVAGASVDAVLSDIGVQAAGSRQSINQNLASSNRQLDRQETASRDTAYFQMRQTNAEREGIEADRLNRIAGVSNLPAPPHANPLSTALQIGSSLLDFGSQMGMKAAPVPTPPTR